MPKLRATLLFCCSVFLWSVVVNPPSHAVGAEHAPGDLSYTYVNYSSDMVWGAADYSGTTVTITVEDGLNNLKDTASVYASGLYGTKDSDWSLGTPPDIIAGDRVIVSSSSGTTHTFDPVGQINAQADPDKDIVSGQLYAPQFSQKLSMECALLVGSSQYTVVIHNIDPDWGAFECDFSNIAKDILFGDKILITYASPDGLQAVSKLLVWPSLRVNTTNDWVGADYEIGWEATYTVKDNAGTVKATGWEDISSYGGWNNPGFQSTRWDPTQPDIVPGDVVELSVNDGFTRTLQVGTIFGQIDLPENTFDGGFYAPWWGSTTLDVMCHPWGAWEAGWTYATVKQTSAPADASSGFFCYWDPAAEWDIQRGQHIGVMYREPDLDRVIAEFNTYFWLYMPVITR